MSVQVFQPFELFHDINGHPVDDGFIWIGQPNLDPETNQISVFFDEALSVPATQPIRTRNGYPVNAGAQTRLYVSATTFSVKIENKNGTQISQSTVVNALQQFKDDLANSTDPAKGAGMVGWARATISQAVSTVHQMLDAQSVSIWEKAFVDLIVSKPNPSDPTTWDWAPALTAAFQYAAPKGRYVDLSAQTIRINSLVTVNAGRAMLRNGTVIAGTGVTATMIKVQSPASDYPVFVDVVMDAAHNAYAWFEIEDTDDPIFERCTFKGTGNATHPNSFGLWLDSARRAIVSSCKFDDLFSNDVVRAIYLSGDSRGAIIFGNTFRNITSNGDDADAIVCEEYGSTDNAFIVGFNYFEGIQKRSVKAGADGWVIIGNRVKVTTTGGLYSVFSLYGSDMVLDGNNVESTVARIDFPIDLGADPTVPLVKNIVITNNVFKLFTYTAGSQDFIRRNSAIENLYVAGNTVDECRVFFGGNPANFAMNNVKFVGNTSKACAASDFELGSGSGGNVKILEHTSEKTVVGAGLILGGTGLTNVSACMCTYDKSFGLSTSDIRFTEAHANVNAGVLDDNAEYRNGVRWHHRTAIPTTGQHQIGDITWRSNSAANLNAAWICTVAGTPGTWVTFAPARLASVYTVTNPVTDRSFDVSTVAVGELAAVVGTLINDLKANGILT